MATQVAVNQMQVPAHIAARIAARQQGTLQASGITSAIVSGDGFQYPKISIRAGRYRLVEDGVETVVGTTLDVIVVGANPRESRIFYGKAYDDSANNVRPDCFSNDGIRPDPSVANPVANGCANCPNAVLGSKMTPAGKQTTLCGKQRHLAVVPAADPEKVYGLSIPVSGLTNLREYFKELQNYGVEPQEVVTELGFDDKVSFPKVTFKKSDKGGGYVPAKSMPRVDAIVASDEVKVAVRLMAAATAPALASPTKPVDIAAPVVDEEDGEPAPEPVVEDKPAKAAKPKTEPVKASSELEAKLDSLFAE